MIEKKIAVCIGTDRLKFLRVRLSLLLVDEDGRVVNEHFHSVALAPGADLEAVRGAIETDLQTSRSIPAAPWPRIPDDEWRDVVAHVAIIHKPAVVEAYRARVRAAQLAKEEAEAAEQAVAVEAAGEV